MKGPTTPSVATRKDESPTFIICATVDSSPTWNNSSTTPEARQHVDAGVARQCSRDLGVADEGQVALRTSPATVLPSTGAAGLTLAAK